METPTGKAEQPGNDDENQVVLRNIDKLRRHRQREESQRSLQDRIADAITAFSGSMVFVYLHVAWFGGWIAANLGIGGLPAFDPFPFGLLTMIVSLEAIFLSTFVLVSQNREAQIADKRSDLDLHIDLLSEHEITRILCLVDAIAKHLKVDDPTGQGADLGELEHDIDPEKLLEEIERHDPQTKNTTHKE